ncbi:MAG: hypothetical protein ACFWTJ_07865 [Lachnoclostridium sp.]|jgi:hypothetical protein
MDNIAIKIDNLTKKIGKNVGLCDNVFLILWIFHLFYGGEWIHVIYEQVTYK